MFSMIKFMIYFGVSFVILSFPISEHRKVFDILDEASSPYTAKVHRSVFGAIQNGFSESARIGKNLINNTSPELDKVKSNSSSINKKRPKSFHQDDYTPQEREALLNVLKTIED